MYLVIYTVYRERLYLIVQYLVISRDLFDAGVLFTMREIITLYFKLLNRCDITIHVQSLYN